MAYFWEGSSEWEPLVQQWGVKLSPSGRLQLPSDPKLKLQLSELKDALAEKTDYTSKTADQLYKEWQQLFAKSDLAKVGKKKLVGKQTKHKSFLPHIFEEYRTDPSRRNVQSLKNLTEFILNKLSECVKDIEPDYEFCPVLTGSMAEGSKIGYPDDFSYRLDAPGLQKKRVDFDESKPLLIDALKSKDSRKSFTPVMDNFTNVLQQAAEQLKEKQPGAANYLLVHHFKRFTSTSYACCMILSWRKTEFAKPLFVKLELTPAIPMEDSKLSERKDPFGEAVSSQAHFLWKYHPLTQTTVAEWSVCAAEQAFMAKLPDVLMQGLQMAKLVTSEGVIPHGELQNLDTYLLKNLLFWSIDRGQVHRDSDPSMRTVLEVAQKVLKLYVEVCFIT